MPGKKKCTTEIICVDVGSLPFSKSLSMEDLSSTMETEHNMFGIFHPFAIAIAAKKNILFGGGGMLNL